MGLRDLLKGMLGSGDSGLGVPELASRLGLTEEAVQAVTVSYVQFTIPKRSGGTRVIQSPHLTFSFKEDDTPAARRMIRVTKLILEDFGYQPHTRKKLNIRRQHQRQLVTGLVVNRTVRLPRRTRRWLRAVEHHYATGRSCNLTLAQIEGWRSFRAMVSRQSEAAGSD